MTLFIAIGIILRTQILISVHHTEKYLNPQLSKQQNSN